MKLIPNSSKRWWTVKNEKLKPICKDVMETVGLVKFDVVRN